MPQVEVLFYLTCHWHRHTFAEKLRDRGSRIERLLKITFTPFVISVDGLLHRESEPFVKCAASCIAAYWDSLYAETLAYV